jgi:diguanylate cyclase (GGDEF)-like protein
MFNPSDEFPCLLLVSDLNTKQIIFANDFAHSVLCYLPGELLDRNIEGVFSKASLIFFESYVYPLLATQSEANEIQVTLRTKNTTKLPAVLHVHKTDDDRLYWAIYSAINRDKLYQELLETRDKLEAKAEELLVLSTTDPLSNLLNRREANARIIGLIDQLRRNKLPLSLVMIDIDDFKSINDQYGHSVGDIVIKEVANILQNSSRRTDVISRWGGEEFLLALHDSCAVSAYDYCQRLHKQIRKIQVSGTFVTVSMGISEIDSLLAQQEDAVDVALAQADAALYQAKQKGKDQSYYFK